MNLVNISSELNYKLVLSLNIVKFRQANFNGSQNCIKLMIHIKYEK